MSPHMARVIRLNELIYITKSEQSFEHNQGASRYLYYK